MANQERQEYDLTVGVNGTERTYRLKLTTAGSMAMEKRTGQKTGELMIAISKVGITEMVYVLHALLQKNHAQEFPNNDRGVEKVANLVDELGGWTEVVPALAAVVGAKNQAQQEVAESGPNPPVDPDGTGSAST